MTQQQPNTNMALWDGMKTVDKKFTKPITGKSYKGDSPNPTYIIMKLTSQLGPIGKGWGFEVKCDRTRLGAPHSVMIEQVVEFHPDKQGPNGEPVPLKKTAKWEIIREEHHEVCIHFWILGEDGQKRGFDAYGGTPMFYMAKSGKWMHDEDAAKKSLTDAYTKGASWLGAAADIFLGIFDDKYTSQPDPNAGSAGQQPANNNGPDGASHGYGQNPGGGTSGGWDGNPEPEPQQNQQQQQGQRQNSAPSGW